MLPALLVLFTRLDAASLVASPQRRALLALVRDAPGLRVSDAARALGVDYKTALHHLRHLERAGRLVAVREGRGARYYAPGVARPAQPPRLLLALRAVAAGADGPQALGRALGVPRGTAGRILAALARRGLVERREGRAVPQPDAERALAADSHDF